MKTTEPNQRDALGLTSAADGNTRGLLSFLRFLQSELSSLALFAPFPELLRGRLRALSTEARDAAEYAWGFHDAAPVRSRKRRRKPGRPRKKR